MNPSDISTISKKMESMSMTQRVVRHNKKLPQPRYSPYNLGSVRSSVESIELTNARNKYFAMRFGVKLSLFMAEAMFLLSDDIRSTLLFCAQIIFKYTENKDVNNPTQVVTRLIYVMLYVFQTYIKPKNGVYNVDGESTQLELIKVSTSQHFAYGIRNLERIVSVLDNGVVVPMSEFIDLSQELEKLEKKLSSSKDVSAANGFARDAIKSNIFDLWDLRLPSPEIMNAMTRLIEMLRPLANEAKVNACSSLIASLQI